MNNELEALRAAGAPERTPLRWHFIERLQARAQTQPPEVQQVLQARLARALADCRRQLQPPAAPAAQPAPPPSPLAELVRTLDARAHAPAAGAPAADDTLPALHGAAPGARQELQAVRQFRSTWARLSVERQLKLAQEQAPRNAGPINSHSLVLRSLVLMRDIAPDYLGRFVAHAEALLCLEQVLQEGGGANKPAKADRADKAAASARAGKSTAVAKAPARRTRNG